MLMRERGIKMNEFRVWDKKENKMYYDGFLIGTSGELYRVVESFENLDNSLDFNIIAVNQENYDVMHCLSGRTDKSCEPVYAKDILRLFLINNCIWFLFFVIFDDLDYVFSFDIYMRKLCWKLEYDKEHTVGLIDTLKLLLGGFVAALYFLYVVFSILIS